MFFYSLWFSNHSSQYFSFCSLQLTLALAPHSFQQLPLPEFYLFLLPLYTYHSVKILHVSSFSSSFFLMHCNTKMMQKNFISFFLPLQQLQSITHKDYKLSNNWTQSNIIIHQYQSLSQSGLSAHQYDGKVTHSFKDSSRLIFGSIAYRYMASNFFFQCLIWIAIWFILYYPFPMARNISLLDFIHRISIRINHKNNH